MRSPLSTNTQAEIQDNNQADKTRQEPLLTTPPDDEDTDARKPFLNSLTKQDESKDSLMTSPHHHLKNNLIFQETPPKSLTTRYGRNVKPKRGANYLYYS